MRVDERMACGGARRTSHAWHNWVAGFSIADMADRAPRSLANGEVVDIGSKRIRYIDTPHVPPRLGCRCDLRGDDEYASFVATFFAHLGNGPPLTES